MNNAIQRLTPLQRISINEKMFELAYKIVTEQKKEEDIRNAIEKETNKPKNEKLNFLGPHLKADLTRYCKLARSVM